MTGHVVQAIASSVRPDFRLFRRCRFRSGDVAAGTWQDSRFRHCSQLRTFALAARKAEHEDGEDGVIREGEQCTEINGQEVDKKQIKRDVRSLQRLPSSTAFASFVRRPPRSSFPANSPQPSPTSQLNHPPDRPREWPRPIDLQSPAEILQRYTDSLLPDDPNFLRHLALKIDSLLRSSSSSSARTSNTSQTLEELRLLLARVQDSAGEIILRDWATERIGLGLPRRILRSVAEDDVEEAEIAFGRVLPFLLGEGSSSGRNAWNPRRAARRAHRLEGKSRSPEETDPGEPQPYLGKTRSERRVLHAYINHLLYLAARSGSTKRYDRLYGLLDEYGLRADSWTYLTRVILADKGNQMGEVARICGMCWAAKGGPLKGEVGEEERMKAIGGPNDPEGEDKKTRGDRVVLNAGLWAFAKAGRWDLIGPIYRKLQENIVSVNTDLPSSRPARSAESGPFPSTSESFYTPSSPRSMILPIGMLPDKITYQLLVRALAHHGNLKAALLVIQDLSLDPRGCHPDVSDFIGLFQGFGRFGNVPTDYPEDVNWFAGGVGQATPSHSTKRAMITPQAIRVDAGRANKPVSAFRRLTDIWATQVNSWDRQDPKREEISPEAQALAEEWTLPTLERVFTAFLALKPPKAPSPTTLHEDDFREPVSPVQTRGPTARALFYILVAFSRMTGEDPDVMRMVWSDLEGKFGPGNREGWIDWKVDSRLTRLRKGWERDDEPRSGTEEID